MDSLAHQDYKELRGAEFQVVVIVEYDDGRLFPLTEDIPCALLPVGNRKLLSYQLDMLTKSGACEIFIAAPKEYEAKLSHFRDQYIRDGLSVDVVPVDKMMGSADGLRAVSDRIRGDFVVVKADFLSQFCIGDLTKKHRLNSSDLTLMLTSVTSSDGKKDDVDVEFVGIGGDGRVVLKTPAIDIDEALLLSKPLLHQCPSLNLRTDLTDMGVYVMSHWVLEFLLDNRRMTSISSDLIPFLIQRQFQPMEYLWKAMPALEHRNRPLEALEPWLGAVSMTSSGYAASSSGSSPSSNAVVFPEHRESNLVDNLFQPSVGSRFASSTSASSLLNASTSPTKPLSVQGTAVESTAVTITAAMPSNKASSSNTDAAAAAAVVGSGSSTIASTAAHRTAAHSNTNNGGAGSDMLRCFAVVYEADQWGPTQTLSPPMSVPTVFSSATNSSAILCKIRTVAAYLNINKDVLLHKHNANSTPWPRLQNYMKKESSVVGDGTAEVIAAAKNVTVKQCCIGANCKIGSMVKLNNCVLMDGVTVGDNCTIQNSIICENGQVENNCKLNDCNVGADYKVPSGTKVKGESFSTMS